MILYSAVVGVSLAMIRIRSAECTIVVARSRDISVVPMDDIEAMCEDLEPMLTCESMWPSGMSGVYSDEDVDATGSKLIDRIERIAPEHTANASDFTWSVIPSSGVLQATDSIDGFGRAPSWSEPVVSLHDARIVIPKQEFPAFSRSKFTQSLVLRQNNAPEHLLAIQSPDTAVDAANKSFTFRQTGYGVDVYLLDALLRRRHLDFADPIDSKTRVVPVLASDTLQTKPCSDPATFDASLALGLVHGVAKRATARPVALTFECSQPYLSDLLISVGAVMRDHLSNPVKRSRVVVISPSLAIGSSTISGSEALSRAIAEAVDLGLIVIAPAGDQSGDACTFMPARNPKVITVGAMDGDAPWSASNRGQCVDIWAPGHAVRGAAQECWTCSYTRSTTSASAYIVAGMVATYLETNPTASSEDVRMWLIKHSVRNTKLDPPVQARMPPVGMI